MVFRACGQSWMGPSGVDAQSKLRISVASSPPPFSHPGSGGEEASYDSVFALFSWIARPAARRHASPTQHAVQAGARRPQAAESRTRRFAFAAWAA